MVRIRLWEPLKCIVILHSKINDKFKYGITTEGSHPSGGDILKHSKTAINKRLKQISLQNPPTKPTLTYCLKFNKIYVNLMNFTYKNALNSTH